MNRQLLIPIVALICLLAKEIGGFELDNEQIDVLTEGVLALWILVGFFLSPKKKK
jgi:uncharacterized membrane protein